MRIALFTEVFLPKIDGITNRLRHTLKSLRARGHELLVIAPETAQPTHPDCQIVRVPGVPFRPYPGLRISAPDPRLVSALRRFSPDVVHAVGPACLGIFGVLAARALSVPVVASYHTDFLRYAPLYGLGWARSAVARLIRSVHNAATLTLCPSEHTRRALVSLGVRNVGIWRGGVDCSLFHPRHRTHTERERLRGTRARHLLLCAGRLSPEKGLERLRPLLAALPEMRLLLAGDGPARPALERHFRGHDVRFTGFLHGEALASVYANADLFVLPSTTETFGFVALEAQSAGCPLVAAHAGGVTEIVRHGETGWLYEPDSAQSLCEAVSRLLGDDALRARLARDGRKHAEQLSWEAETARLERAYELAREVHASARSRRTIRALTV